MPDRVTPGLDSAGAWAVVLAGFVASFVTFGISYCFGVFLKPIALTFDASHAAMSALFSTITAISFFAAPVTGKLADRYGPRPVVTIGALLIGSGLILAAHVHTFAFLFVTYGVGLGGGVACTYIPTVSAVGECFKRYRDLALGLAISGIGCGTFVAAPLSAMLIARHGWRTTFEIFGSGGAALLLFSAALLFRPPSVGEKNKASTTAKVRTRPFVLQYVSLLFSGTAIYISLVYLPVFAEDLGVSRVAGAALVGYLGASSVIGRLGLGALSRRFGLMRVYQGSYLILLISFGLWVMAGSYTALVIFALTMGVGYGGIAAMAPAVAAVTFGVEALGELLGMLFTGLGVAALFGPPSAGILIDHYHNYKLPAFVAAGASVLALLFAILLQVHIAKPKAVEPTNAIC